MKNNRCKKGFTLIELLVVVLIIGILAAIALPQYQKSVEKTRMAEMIVMVGNVKRAVDAYVLQNGLPSGEEAVELWDTGLLDIDLSQGMECVDHICEKKQDVYIARCDRAGCNIRVGRLTEPGNLDSVSWMASLETEGTSNSWQIVRTLYTDESGKRRCQAFTQAFGGICTNAGI